MDNILKKPYVKISIIITIIIIFSMYITQPYWINSGLNIVYNEYPLSEIENLTLTGEVYIVSGIITDSGLYDNITLKAHIVNNITDCNIQPGYVKLLVINEPIQYTKINITEKFEIINETITRIVVLKVLDGCK